MKARCSSEAPTNSSASVNWFFQFEADAWDRQFKADVHGGKLDTLAEKAIRDDDAEYDRLTG